MAGSKAGDVRVCFVKASGQNVFFDELLDALSAALARTGVATESACDYFPPLSSDLVYVTVPHEYLPLTAHRAHPTPAQLRRTVVLATEQPGTSWFEETVAVAAQAAATVDLHPLGVAALRSRGVNATYLPLGYVPEWDQWRRRDVERPIDLTFLGGYTPRRARAVALCGRALQCRRASLHLVETWRPHTAEDAFFFSGARKFAHLAASKVLLSAHRADNSYLEWQRVLGAVANGCVVLTEHSTGFAPLVPGEHFVSVELESLPSALERLLGDESELHELRERAYELLKTEMPIEKSVGILRTAVELASKEPVARSTVGPQPAAPSPKRPMRPVPEWRRVHDQGDPVRAAVKRLVIGQRRLERKLAALAEPTRSPPILQRFGRQPAAAPKISVVLTLFNLAQTIEEALESVAVTNRDDVEVIVVDDASTDESADVASSVLERLTWIATTLLRHTENMGLPASRNAAVALARGEFVFVMDADNALYPHGLGRLADALDEDPEAAFAYGILEKFDETGPTDLVSWHPWSVDRFRYGNYIDAMAIIRRSALEEVGGYIVDDRIFGWEDFALWCALTESGQRGVHVPEIVGRYRGGHGSMITTSNIDTSDAWAFLVERFPFLTDDVVDEVALGTEVL